jgi:hypothetical protein
VGFFKQLDGAEVKWRVEAVNLLLGVVAGYVVAFLILFVVGIVVDIIPLGVE